MTRIFMNGKQIPKEKLSEYVAVFDRTGKILLRIEKKEEKSEKAS